MSRASATASNNADAGIVAACGFISLHTADPGTTGASEVSGGSYARQTVSWGSPSSGTVANTNIITFSVPTGTIAYFGLWSLVTAGVYQVGGQLSASVTFASTGNYTIPVGGLTMTAS